jgi:hypothetical protein
MISSLITKLIREPRLFTTYFPQFGRKILINSLNFAREIVMIKMEQKQRVCLA